MAAAGLHWDERWRVLSPEARRAVIEKIKAPASVHSTRPPFILSSDLPAAVGRELVEAGLVERRFGPTGRPPERLVVPPAAVRVVHWVQGLAERRLLAADGAGRLAEYVSSCFYGPTLDSDLRPVFHEAKVFDPFVSRATLLGQYVVSREWPGLVARSLHLPLAEAIVRAIDEAGGVVLQDELYRRFADGGTEKVRETIDLLLRRLALFSGLRQGTLELEVGLLAPVREGLRRAREVRARPALATCPAPAEPLPEGGYAIDDLRAVLVELAARPGRLRQDHSLFQKERGRFESALEPLPAWTAEVLRLDDPGRVDLALRLARWTGLTREVQRDDGPWLEPSKDGQEWLADGLAGQYRRLFDRLRQGPEMPSGGSLDVDARLLGSSLVVIESPKREGHWGIRVTAADRDRLREVLYAALAELPAEQFVRLDSFLAHTTFGPHNPLLLGGREARQVTVLYKGSLVAPLEEQYESVARRALTLLVLERLVPLGCVRAGLAGGGGLCIARNARLDAYFGRAVADEAVGGPAVGARVVVQPDFSIILIGQVPAAAAELAPFCERAGGRGSRGSLQLKITREAVVAAVAGGLSGKEIEERLGRHSSVPMPANVLHEVRRWADWVRTVEAQPLVVLRCADRDTADRTAAALGRQAERLGETLVALPAGGLSSAERNKLRQHGILVSATGQASRRPGRKKHR